MSSSSSVLSSATRAFAVVATAVMLLTAADLTGAAAVDATTLVVSTADATTASTTTSAGTTVSAGITDSAATSAVEEFALNGLPLDVDVTASTPSPSISVPVKNEDIYSFIIHSKIRYRYAQTVVSSRVANKGNTSHEVQFFVTLPESAFVSKFLMEINNKVYEAYVKEKKEAKEEYLAAVNSGQTAAHVEQNARDSNKFTVSVNVEAESKVTFNLTYEQLLTMKLGLYENTINIQPGQAVKNLQVIVDIDESSNITTLEVPDIKTVNEIETTTSKNKLAQVVRKSGNAATITWSPTVKEQLAFSEHGVKGQFIVQYDVDHKSTPNQVLIDDGYFVHFFAPTDLKPLRTHVIFVLDVSGSMVGQKLPQVKEAMTQILSEITSDDFFTIILFSDFAQVWTVNATQETSNRWDEFGLSSSKKNLSLESLGESRFVFPATAENIQYAKKFIHGLSSESSTNMEDALTKAHAIAKLGETRFNNGSNNPKPIIVFLTDGEPTTGITEPQDLIKYVSVTNEEKYPIFSLGFGDGADMDFLKKLSLNNTGFARIIYEASDASLQLHNFYKEISSPVLSNVTFKYADTQVENITVTKKSFSLLFRGTELVVAGKLKNGSLDESIRENPEYFNSTLNADSIDGNFVGSGIVTCFDIPILTTVTVTEKKQIGHLEKLWAYLNIQQLMDKYELNKNENSTDKAKALELALKYSFVTPLTSLVVVKPNDTSTSADPQKIKPLNNNNNYGGPLSMTNNFAMPSGYFASPISLKANYLPGPPGLSVFKNPSVAAAATGILPADDTDMAESMDLSTYTPSTRVTQTTETLNSTNLHDISELTWLNVSNNTQPSIKLNETNTVYQVLLNTSGQSYHNCTTPDNVQGNCKHLRDCIVSSILNSLDVYIPLFCPIENIYAGICCSV